MAVAVTRYQLAFPLFQSTLFRCQYAARVLVWVRATAHSADPVCLATAPLLYRALGVEVTAAEQVEPSARISHLPALSKFGLLTRFALI